MAAGVVGAVGAGSCGAVGCSCAGSCWACGGAYGAGAVEVAVDARVEFVGDVRFVGAGGGGAACGGACGVIVIWIGGGGGVGVCGVSLVAGNGVLDLVDNVRHVGVYLITCG